MKSQKHKTNSDEAAFSNVHERGLTRREYFAAMAMQGLHSDSSTDYLEPKSIAEMSVNMADALIAALNDSEVSDD